MIPTLKALNLLQTLLFIAALIWFFFTAPNIGGETVLIVVALFVLWLIFIAVVGKALYDADKKEKPNAPDPHQISVYEFIRRAQEGSGKQ